jgi:GTPase Era involved in 16S rRNA processing
MDAIKPVTNQSLNSETMEYKPCVVVMGKTAAGKTTLINELCGTKHAAGKGKDSVTRNLYRNDVN